MHSACQCWVVLSFSMKEPVSKCPINGTLTGHQRAYPELPVLYGIFHKLSRYSFLVASLEFKTIVSLKFLPFKIYLFSKLSMRGQSNDFFLGRISPSTELPKAYWTCLSYIVGSRCVQFAKSWTTRPRASRHIDGSIKGDHEGVDTVCPYVTLFCFQFHGCCWAIVTHPLPSLYFFHFFQTI